MVESYLRDFANLPEIRLIFDYPLIHLIILVACILYGLYELRKIEKDWQKRKKYWENMHNKSKNKDEIL